MKIFTAQTGDYTQIASLLTPTDCVQFLAIVATIATHVNQSRKIVNDEITDEYNTFQDYSMGKAKKLRLPFYHLEECLRYIYIYFLKLYLSMKLQLFIIY